MHGNFDALQTVLDDIDNEDIDKIYNLGDNIGIGQQIKYSIQYLIVMIWKVYVIMMKRLCH